MALLPTLLFLLASPATAQVVGGDWPTHHQFDGSSSNDRIGDTVSNAGDVNNDGFDDIIVGAPWAAPGGLFGAGSAFVYSGADGSILYQFHGAAANDNLGNSVSNAGDVNNDGFEDVIVGAPYTALAGGAYGSAFIYSGADGSILQRFDATASSGTFGHSVSNAGDVNADGVDDVIIGAWAADPGGLSNAGSAFVYSGTGGAYLYRFDGLTAGDYLGDSVSNAGDINADGFDDLIVGAWAAAPGGLNDAGSAFVFSGANGSVLHQFDGAAAGDYLGDCVSNAGDVNADGFDDLIVGAPSAIPGLITSAGSAYVFSGADGSTLYQFDGSAIYDYLGYSVSNAGDINADGFADLIVGAVGMDPGGLGYAGSALVYSGADGSMLHRFDGATAGDHLGDSVSNAGDVNADGLADLVIGAVYASPGGLPLAGSAYVFGFRPLLTASTNTLSAASGGTISFDLAFPQQDANMPYRILFSTSGTGPSFYGVDIPLSRDPYARNSFLGSYPFQTVVDMHGTLDASGTATASFSVPANALAGAIGRTLNFAAIVMPTGLLPTTSSVAVTLEIVP
jgi:hypothetical protein